MNTHTYISNGVKVEDENLNRKVEGFWQGGALFRDKYKNPAELSRWYKSIHKRLMFASMPAEFHAKQAQREELFIKLYGNPQLALEIPAADRKVMDNELRKLDRWLLDMLHKYRQNWTPREVALVVYEEK